MRRGHATALAPIRTAQRIGAGDCHEERHEKRRDHEAHRSEYIWCMMVVRRAQMRFLSFASIFAFALVFTGTAPLLAQEVPGEYQEVLKALGKQGDYKANVLKVNIPRNDLSVTVANVKTPTPFGFGGWLAMTKGQGMDVMMGDLVLTQDEVNPVMSALLDNGLEVTALHNHFFWEEPRLAYMHVHGHGDPMDLARRVKPALDLIGKGGPAAAPAPAAATPPPAL